MTAASILIIDDERQNLRLFPALLGLKAV